MRDSILLTSDKHLHDPIMLLRNDGLARKTSLTTSLFIEVPVPITEIERVFIYVLVVSRFSL